MEDQEVVEQEVVETFDFIDPMTRQKVALPVEMQPLIQNVIAKSNKDARDKYKLEIQNLNLRVEEFDDIRQQLDDYKSKNETEADRIKRENDKYTRELNLAKTETANTLKQLESEKLNNAIFGVVASNPDVYNPQQTKDLFMIQSSPKIIKENGEYVMSSTVDGVEMGMSDGFSKWLAKPENSNLLKNNLSSGGGTQTPKGDTVGKTIKRSDFDRLSPSEQSSLIAAGTIPTD